MRAAEVRWTLQRNLKQAKCIKKEMKGEEFYPLGYKVV
jgi:hypothetical protein